MEIGETVLWVDSDNRSRRCVILSVNDNNTYDIILPERNVLFDSIYRPMESENKISKGELIIYKKRNELYEALVSKVDWASKSLQIQIIMRNIL